MNKNSILLQVFTILLVVSIGGCGDSKEEAVKETPQKLVVRSIPVSMVDARTGTINQIIPLNGLIVPDKQVTVVSRVPGKISKVVTREGATVRKGALLATVNRDIVGATYRENELDANVGGVIAKVHVEVGSPVAPGAPIATIIAVEKVKAVVRVIEADLGKVAIGQHAEVKVETYDQIFTGKVTFIGPMLDPISHMATVEIKLDNSHKKLLPGMSARVNLAVGKKDNAIVVPRSAVIKRDGKDIVFAVRENVAYLSEVKVGVSDLHDIEIVTGVNADDRVVISEQFILQDNTHVVSKNDGTRK